MSGVEILEPCTWGELQEALFADSWRPDLGRFRSSHAFRGHGRAGDTLATSLVRLGGDPAGVERHLLRNFRKYARSGAVPQDSLWNWLAVAKHHGLPTRLLDWTFSPQVALHFATATRADMRADGAIWMLDYVRAHERLPAALRDAMRAEGCDVLTVELMSEAAPTLEALAGMAGEDVFAAFFEPPSLDERIVNQYALFSVLSSPTASMEDWLARHPGVARKVLLPAALKWEVRDKLDQAGVNERVLFPGLDGLSAWLGRHYAPRDP